MSARLDIIVFGASGFTGKHVIKELIKLQSNSSFTFGVAGRSIQKLQDVLSTIYERDDNNQVVVESPILKPASDIPIFEADINDAESLNKITQSARVIINCVGPFCILGEPVVQACIQSGTDYVDITGEPEFAERMYLKYHQKAIENNVLIVSTCGFDSIPADLGVLYAQEQLDRDMKPSHINSFLSFTGPGAINYGTYLTAVYNIANESNIHMLRKQINYPKLPLFGGKVPHSWMPFYHSHHGQYAVTFLGSDASVVKRTQLGLLNEEGYHPTQYSAYLLVPNIFRLLIIMILGGLFLILARFELGRRILLAYPTFFTCGIVKSNEQNPADESIQKTRFSSTFYTTAYNNDPCYTSEYEMMTLVTKVSGPDPGYKTTPICVTQAALCILANKGKKIKKSGVLTPGTAFYKTDMLQRLQDYGIKMSVLEKKRVNMNDSSK